MKIFRDIRDIIAAARVGSALSGISFVGALAIELKGKFKRER
ncbi:hypothetical protein [Paenibacillus phytohabitans]